MAIANVVFGIGCRGACASCKWQYLWCRDVGCGFPRHGVCSCWVGISGQRSFVCGRGEWMVSIVCGNVDNCITTATEIGFNEMSSTNN